MKKFYAITILLSIFLLGFGFIYSNLQAENLEPLQHDSSQEKKIVMKLTLEGAITPSSLDLLSEALDKAEEANAKALIVSMDTPGGLMTSMDKMIRRILSSNVPVITYISPSGASCGSAGVFILYASHLAAMSPASNIGSATPVQMGGSSPDGKEPSKPQSNDIPDKAGTDDQVNLKRKLINHAVAQIKSLALYHGRDPKFAERSITFADNITSIEAKNRSVIEIIAENDQDLLQQANGRKIRMVTGTVTLDLQNVEIINLETDFRQEFLKLIADPNIAYILMMIGTLGLIAEIQYPGAIFPGVAGVICLILGLYSMHTLSLSYAGVGLMMVGLICFVLEVSIMSYGMLTIAGIISMVIGAMMLADSGNEMARVSIGIALSTSLATGSIAAFLAFKALQAMKQKLASGDDFMKSLVGKANTDITKDSGQVFINGEIWQGRSIDSSIPKGSHVIVDSRDGLILRVKIK
ncbi:NfeD family protein [Leptospira sp. GIMC2001]|uniref:NfeD family protein n=1 Tax=Leptospira sp. GIMC2001 TaxID=1513297 RepID=UPI00234A1029|nr:nodulation protein NfeD [Leptospira sp. GIMC2001]WCL48563.1 nodulation protein NfeD [Leptospira sp. GIMC2001]